LTSKMLLPKQISHQLGLYLHILVEIPASVGFLFFPSRTLKVPQPHAHALIRQYGTLLCSTNALLAIILLSRPSDESDGTENHHDFLERRVAGALVVYHIAPCLRALSRIRGGEGERSRGMLASPKVHLGLHVLCIVALIVRL